MEILPRLWFVTICQSFSFNHTHVIFNILFFVSQAAITWNKFYQFAKLYECMLAKACEWHAHYASFFMFLCHVEYVVLGLKHQVQRRVQTWSPRPDAPGSRMCALWSFLLSLYILVYLNGFTKPIAFSHQLVCVPSSYCIIHTTIQHTVCFYKLFTCV